MWNVFGITTYDRLDWIQIHCRLLDVIASEFLHVPPIYKDYMRCKRGQNVVLLLSHSLAFQMDLNIENNVNTEHISTVDGYCHPFSIWDCCGIK